MIMKGQKINDRYQIIKSIGEGGMANVYLAYDTILDRNVAVKVLRGDLAQDEKFVRRFQREALSASSLSHPNIVEVYDVGEDGGSYYIVMEYIEGKHLKELIKKRGKLTLSEVIDIMSQVCDGLATAHDSYIIHRDIKPQNIMILDSGLVKITDFGIAMALNSTQLTQTNSVMGSVHYLPPEQASGKGSTMQSDIYSMGILMYELLTGTLPFRGENAVEIALKQLKEPIPNLKDKLPDIPNSIVNIVKRSTAKNPKNRYVDAREMLDDIKTAMDDSRVNEKIIEFKYSDIDEIDKEKKKSASTSEVKKPNDDQIVVSKKVTEDEVKKENKILLTLGAIFTGIVVLVTAICVILPRVTAVDNVKVPDVSDMDEVKAEEKLIEEGLKVNSELKYTPSDTIEEGKVVKTDPAAGRTVKEGTEVTIYVSSGANSITLDDYTGKNYIEVRAILESSHSVNVTIEKKAVEDPSEYNASEIIGQSPSAGEKVLEGGNVTLYIPDIEELYPDFTTGDYSLSEIKEFAKKYSLTLNTKYVETSEYPAGTIMAQSRPANSKIAAGASFTITIAQEPADVDNPEGETNE
ncbi:MAG: Stk1 family PASTA domain-containing Ser/Thr kinase [Bacilli bacterium]|nr:Stk1 family PASTA domain-containing Ser/Thr kinase [Bacilli bacterium]